MRKQSTLRMLFGMLCRLIRRERAVALLLLGAVALSIVAALLPPMVLERIIDSLTDGRMIALSIALGYLGFTALSAAADAAMNALLAVFGQKMTHTLRTELCAKLTRLPAAVFVREEPGRLVSRFVGDVDAVEDIFADGVIGMLVDVCKVFSLLAVIYARSRGLAVLLLAAVPLLIVFTRWTQKRMLKAQLRKRAAIARTNGIVPETIENIRTVHTCRCEGYLEQKYDSAILDGYAAMESVNRCDAVYSPVVTVLRASIIALMMVLCASNSEGVVAFFGMSVGTSVAVTAYITKLFAPIESLGMEIQTIQSAIAGAKRVNELLTAEERPETDPTLTPERLTGFDGSTIELKDITFAYEDGRNVLEGMSFAVERGEQVTLSGRTGAGKSTIFKLLLGLYEPQAGEVRICGADAVRIPAESRRRLIGYVEQSFTAVPGTVLEQVTLFDPQISRQAALSAIDTVGLAEVVAALPEGADTVCSAELFSQGQWQLLSIARAIAADPAILLLDEITANLDSDTEQAVLRAVQSASARRTVLSISHRLYRSIGGRRVEL